MKVIIAEKPDQASTLCAQFQRVKKDGYFEIKPNELFPEGAFCTWAIGHLTELSSPETYHPEWKKWSLQSLPIIPERFQYEVTKTKAKQFNIVSKLLQHPNVNEIIHAGDAGREGELIIRNIITLARVKKPLKRLWISSLTPASIIEGFKNLLDDEKTKNLYYEAYSRACADWLVGMNASRVYSLLLKEKGMNDVFSAGRVQTPTLALIVKREKEIDQFKPEPFWEVIATFNFDGKKYKGKWQNKQQTRVMDHQLANKIAAFCENKPAEIKELTTERKEYQPPLLFNLSSLQATANKAFKFSPKKTLDIVQSLYQKGIVSYPRSDSTYVTKGEAEQFPDILNKLSQFDEYKDFYPLPNTSLLHNSRYVNEKKVTDHYAIIPTDQVKDPKRLSGDEHKIYDMIIRRLIAAHYEKAIFDYSTLITLVDARAEFVTKGKQQIQEGWRKVIFDNDKEKDELLPTVQQNDKGVVAKVETKESKTQPPKRYTEGQLITLMKTAGKYLDNDELEKILSKVEGLGTEATRAGIITMLKDRKYIDIKKNQVYATDKGKVLIEAIGEQILASPSMTAKWEQRLSEIGDGQASPSVFMEQTKKLSAKIVSDAISISSTWNFEGLDIESIQRKPSSRYTIGKKVGKCKLCDGDVVDKGEFYGCANYKKTNCRFTFSKKILGKKISQANIQKILNGEPSNLIKGFKKGEKTFDAKLGWDNGKIQFLFETSGTKN
ncbi:DNA topoisomerase III [Bacillus weihaiensis]|uniref:DNA topoisomerase n=1 Tax=Bacillus weihaiensis TaxID=1547283 RepID=A0A1L3MS57_9BACI|nr:DNA topoisomerase III [Bacillus weihaiensis]APH05169.1 DNA topoisomerase III [Bacillus weihaiensis]